MNKKLDTIKKIVTILLTTAAICMALFTVISVTTFNKKDRDLFGYKGFIVLSDSMSATDFSAGDLVVVKEVPVDTIEEGDIIAFISTDTNSFGEVFTHKVRKVNFENDTRTFTTYGTTTGVDDETPADEFNVLGKYQFSIPKVGRFFNFVKTTPGYICCILLPFLVLIILQIIDTIKLFKQYKQEQMEDINKEREEIRKQKEESEKLLKELQELKEQLSKKENDNKQ